MFKCQRCSKTSEKYGKPVKVTLETRAKTYENSIKVGRERKTKLSKGYETVKEIATCGGCAKALQVQSISQ